MPSTTPPEHRKAIIDSYPEHEREARTRGVPSLGSGRAFPVLEEAILVDPFTIHKEWFQIVGMDFGWDHPFAATRNAWDKDNDIWYVAASYRDSFSCFILATPGSRWHKVERSGDIFRVLSDVNDEWRIDRQRREEERRARYAAGEPSLEDHLEEMSERSRQRRLEKPQPDYDG